MYEHLYVIGNGFDIAHGFDTRLSDFVTWMNDSSQIDFLSVEDYMDYDQLWYSFEDALANFDFGQLVEDSYPIEDTPQGEAKFIGDIQYLLDFCTKISPLLKEWLGTIDFNSYQCICNKLSNNAFYLTFNYTPTLEKLYKIPRNQILHIHGNLLFDEILICGHDNIEYVNELREMNNEYQGDYVEHNLLDLKHFYYSSTLKNVNEIIKKNVQFFQTLSNIKKIDILGHSLNTIDFPYFKIISSSINKNCIWRFHCYSDVDVSSARRLAMQLQINNYKIFTRDDAEYYMN